MQINCEMASFKTEPCQALQTIREKEMRKLNLRGTFLFKYTKHNLANIHLFSLNKIKLLKRHSISTNK